MTKPVFLSIEILKGENKADVFLIQIPWYF